MGVTKFVSSPADESALLGATTGSPRPAGWVTLTISPLEAMAE